MKCLACGHTNLSEQFTACDIHDKPFRYLTCADCGTLQIAEFDDSILAYAYEKSYYGSSRTKFKWPFSALFDWGKSMAASKIARLIPDTNKHMLDIGCGKAELLQKLHDRGYLYLWANDIEKPTALPDYINWLNGAFPEIDSSGLQFDFISLNHVFEHLPAPAKVISELYELLNPEGMVLLSLPNISSSQSRKYEALWLHLDPPRHLHLIPPQQLKKMFVAAGFSLESESYSSLIFNPFGYLQSWLNQRLSKRDLLYEYLRKGRRLNGLKEFFQLVFSFLYALLSFPVYLLMDQYESKNKKSGTVEFVFKKDQQQ